MLRQLIGHSAVYTFANLVSRGTVLVWLIVLPRFLNAADYGAFGLIITIAAIVNVSLPLEVSQGLARYYSTAPFEEQPAWASTAWTFSLLVLCGGGALGMVASPWLSRDLFGGDAYLAVFRIALGYFVLNTSFLFVQNQFRWSFRTHDYAIVTLIFAVVTLAVSVGFAASLSEPLLGVLLGLLIGAAAGVLLGLIGLRGTIGLQIDRAKLQHMLHFSLPLVPASLSLMVSTYGSRFILNDLLTLKDVGLFTWAGQVANIPAMSLLGIQAAVTPLVMKHYADPETPATLARGFEAIFAGSLWMCVALGLLTPEFIRFLGYSSYAGAAPLVMVLAPAYLMLQLYVLFPGFAVTERTSFQLAVSLLAAVANVALNYWLIGAMGLAGAALATFGSSAIFLTAWIVASNRLYPIPVRWRKLAVYFAACAATGIIGQRLPAGSLSALLIKGALLLAVAVVAAVFGLLHAGQLRTLLDRSREFAEPV